MLFFGVVFLVTIGLMLAGRILGDRAGKKLDQENKAKLFDIQSPYWILPALLLTIVPFIFVWNNVSFYWMFIIVFIVDIGYSLFVIYSRRKLLIAKEFPNDFIKIRTLAISLQMTAVTLLPFFMFIMFILLFNNHFTL